MKNLFLFILFYSSLAYSANDWCLANRAYPDLPCGHRSREYALANGRCTMNSRPDDTGSYLGGYVANTALVEQVRSYLFFRRNKPIIGIGASVCEAAHATGDSQILDHAMLRNDAGVSDNAIVSGNARIWDFAQVYNSGSVSGNANLFGFSSVIGNAFASGNAHVSGRVVFRDQSSIVGNARVSGNIIFGGFSSVSNHAIVTGDGTVNGHQGVSTEVQIVGNTIINVLTERQNLLNQQVPNNHDESSPIHALIRDSENEDQLMTSLTLNGLTFNVNQIHPANGKSLLELSIEKRFLKLAKKLLEKGADPYQKNNLSQKSILEIELEKGENSLLKMMIDLNPTSLNEVIKFLSENVSKTKYSNLMDSVVPVILELNNAPEIISYLRRINRSKNLNFSERITKRLRIEENKLPYVKQIESLVDQVEEASTICTSGGSEGSTPIQSLGTQTSMIIQATCPVCLEDSNTRDFQYRNCRCQHTFVCSSECFSQSLHSALEGSQYPAKCPGRCGGTMERKDLKEIQSRGIDINGRAVLRYRIANAHDKARRLGGIEFCRSTDCFNMVKKDQISEDGHFYCFLCGDLLCVRCGYNHLDKESCEEATKEREGDDSFQKLLHDPRSNIRPCPHPGCGIATEKTEACDHVTCRTCKNKWDWRLGRIGDAPAYYSKTDGSEPRTYRVKGDFNPKTQTDYKDYRDGVPADE